MLIKEKEDISHENLRHLLHFVVLCSTTNEYLFFIRDKIARIREIDFKLQELNAPNRKIRKTLEKRNDYNLRKFKRTIKDTQSLLQTFADTWDNDPKYSKFVDSSIDTLADALDTIDLKKL